MIVYIVHTYFVADGKLSLLEFFYFLRIVLNLCGSTIYLLGMSLYSIINSIKSMGFMFFS